MNDDIPPIVTPIGMGMSQPTTPSVASSSVQNDLMSILGNSNPMPANIMKPMNSNPGSSSSSNMGSSNNIMDSLNMNMMNMNMNQQSNKTVMLSAEEGKGMMISAEFTKRNNQYYMDMTFTNKTAQPLSELAIQFNKNTYGLIPSAPIGINMVEPNASKDFSLPLGTNGPVQKMNPPLLLQIAVKNNVGVYYFQTLLPSSLFESLNKSANDAFSGLLL